MDNFWFNVDQIGNVTEPIAGSGSDTIVNPKLNFIFTPVNDGNVQLTATLPGTDESITVPATSAGDGEWVATVTFPSEGAWEVQVTHSLYETSPAVPLAVTSADARRSDATSAGARATTC